MSRLTGRDKENRDNFMEVDETSKPDAGINLVHLNYYRDFGDIFADDFKPLVRPSPTVAAPAEETPDSSSKK